MGKEFQPCSVIFNNGEFMHVYVLVVPKEYDIVF